MFGLLSDVPLNITMDVLMFAVFGRDGTKGMDKTYPRFWWVSGQVLRFIHFEPE